MKPQPLLVQLFSVVPDPRNQDDRLKHKLVDALVLVVLGMLCGAETMDDVHDFGIARQDWLKQFLELPNGIPSPDTIGRVLSVVEFSEVENAVRLWVSLWQESRTQPRREIISFDGKFVNSSRARSYDPRSALIMVSAYATLAGICLGSEQSRLKKNEGEKRATERLIEGLFLKGSIVTLDAGGATPRIVDKIVEKKADWLIGLKTNQNSLFKLAAHSFEEAKATVNTYSTEETGHGRKEKRSYRQLLFDECDSPAFSKNWEKQKEKWPSLKSFIRVDSERATIEKGEEKTTHETRYYFSSLEDDIKEAANAARSHWAVENNLHWTLDVVFREDGSRTRARHAGENLAAVRRLVLNIVKQENSSKTSMRRKLKKCGWDLSYLEKVLDAQPAPH